MVGAIPREVLGYFRSSCTWCLPVRDWARLVLGWARVQEMLEASPGLPVGPGRQQLLRNIRGKPAHAMKFSWKQLILGLCSLVSFPDQFSG